MSTLAEMHLASAVASVGTMKAIAVRPGVPNSIHLATLPAPSRARAGSI